MGVYCNKITRRARTISGRKIHTYVFAYRSSGSMFDEYPKGRTHDEHMSFVHVRPTEEAWKRSGEDIRQALFVADYEDGAEVYRAYGVSHYDTGPGGEVVGHLRSNGSKLRFEPAPEVNWKVTFKGTHDHGDVAVYVTGINEERAKANASMAIKDEDVHWNTYTTMYPKFEKNVMPPLSERDALDMATVAIKSLSSNDFDLSRKVEAIRLIGALKEERDDSSNQTSKPTVIRCAA